MHPIPDTPLRGRFITVEGIDGAGKTSQLQALVMALEKRGITVCTTREPGGTPLGETLRGLVLEHDMHPETEALMMFASRREHLACCIQPALDEGHWVVCDRFSDATYAYQVGGRGLEPAKFEALEQWVHPGFAPDLTFLFDLPVACAVKRRAQGRAQSDRFEQEGMAFFDRVRRAYLARAALYPERIVVLDAKAPIQAVQAQLLDWLERRFFS
jgi:dTMP kinase